MSETPAFQATAHDPALAGRKRPNVGGAIAPHFGDKSVTWAFAQILEKTFVTVLHSLTSSETPVQSD
jgi:hypothetical protein